MSVVDQFAWPLQLCAFSTAATWVASIVTGNCSQVDRLWTFLPTIYTAYFALLPLLPQSQLFFLCPYVPATLLNVSSTYSPRAMMMFALIVIWMFRLSYNTFRRGLFNLKDEDYRWVVLRTQIPPWFFQVINLTFIAAIQNLLLLLLGVPAYYAVIQPHNFFTSSDLAIASLSTMILLLEFTSDNQQYSFQTYKSAPQDYNAIKQWPGARINWTPDDAKRGFITRGLWAYSRHPNFAGEQTFWWLITLAPILAPYPPNIPEFTLSDIQELFSQVTRGSLTELHAINFLSDISPLLPAIFLSILFFSSTTYTEAITRSKYTVAYDAYQKRVGMFGNVILKTILFKLRSKAKQEEINQLVWGSSETKTK